MGKTNIKRSMLIPVLLLIIAVALILFSAIGAARAELNHYSKTYEATLHMHTVDVALQENGNDIGPEGLLTRMLAKDEEFVYGKSYNESFAVKNTGTVDEYIRVVVYKYWKDDKGVKRPDLSPELIRLNLEGNGWMRDANASTPEREIYYYSSPVPAASAAAEFKGTIGLDPEVKEFVKQTRKGNIITTTYVFDGMSFCIEIEADAVQTHNAEDAIISAWGRAVSIAKDGSLRLSGGGGK